MMAMSDCDHTPAEDKGPATRPPALGGKEQRILTAWATCEHCGEDLQYDSKRGWILDDGWLSERKP